MKKVVLALFILSTYSITLLAQENKQREVGLILSNFDNFGLVYRFGTERSLWRTSALVLSGYERDQANSNNDIHEKHTGVNVRFGREFRKELANKLDLRYGADLVFTYQKSDYEIDDTGGSAFYRHTVNKTFSPGLDFVIGLNYALTQNFLIGAEVLPGFDYTTGTSSENYDGVETKYDVSGFSYGISSTGVLLSLVYKF